ncbi:MAG TPA: cyclic nucleotide-binding domain-containing protein [Candidatus Limnocylindrales bacterium]
MAGLTQNERISLLREVGLFAGVGDDGLAAVAAKATEIAFEAGRTIVRQGEVGTGFFLIVSGQARVVRDGRTLAELGPGQFFGELSLLDQQPRIAQVVAETPTACLALASWDFEAILTSQPGVALAILRGVARRLRAVSEEHSH